MLKPLAPAHASRLREFFSAAGFAAEEIQRRAANKEPPEPSVLTFLMGWFCYGRPCACESAGAMIQAADIEAMVESGMLIKDGGQLAPQVLLTPFDSFLIASDTAARLHTRVADTVVWPNPTTRALRDFTIRRPFAATLDLGSGNGIQAIMAASHSRHVAATDLNPRAEQFGRFNASLNGFANVECLTGDTFDPVAGRSFDLILANPPFFVTPSSGLLYCENAMELDGYVRRIVREAPRHLNEGGFAQIVLEWVRLRGQTWQDRLQEWLAGTGCDAWAFHMHSQKAEDYGRDRLRQTNPADMNPDTLARWMEYYRANGVEEICGGVLALRRRSGNNWVRMEEMPVTPKEPYGDAVWQAFAGMDFLDSHPSDEDMLAARIRLSPDAQLDQQLRQVDGKWKSSGMTLSLTRGIRASMGVAPPVADFLAGLDGRETLAERIAAVSAQVDAPLDLVQRECLVVARKLIESRVLIV